MVAQVVDQPTFAGLVEQAHMRPSAGGRDGETSGAGSSRTLLHMSRMRRDVCLRSTS